MQLQFSQRAQVPAPFPFHGTRSVVDAALRQAFFILLRSCAERAGKKVESSSINRSAGGKKWVRCSWRPHPHKIRCCTRTAAPAAAEARACSSGCFGCVGPGWAGVAGCCSSCGESHKWNKDNAKPESACSSSVASLPGRQQGQSKANVYQTKLGSELRCRGPIILLDASRCCFCLALRPMNTPLRCDLSFLEKPCEGGATASSTLLHCPTVPVWRHSHPHSRKDM